MGKMLKIWGTAAILLASLSGCAGRPLEPGDKISGASNTSTMTTATPPATLVVQDSAGGQHVAHCQAALPSADQTATALELAWSRVLDMADAPKPVTTWRAGELGGEDVDADGNITVAWGGSFGCTPDWVNGLLLYRRYLLTGNMGYAFPSGALDQKAYLVDQAEGNNARAALADSGL